MSLAEYWNWHQFAALEPFLPERVDIAGAIVTTTLANINRGKNGEVRKLEDYLLVQRALNRQPSKSDERESMHLIATMATLGGKIK